MSSAVLQDSTPCNDAMMVSSTFDQHRFSWRHHPAPWFNASNPLVMQVTIKQSKTDPFRKGVLLVLRRTFKLPCPVAAMASYLIVRGVKPGPLFHFKDGRSLTRQRFVNEILSGLRAAGIDASKYNCHSFDWSCYYRSCKGD